MSTCISGRGEFSEHTYETSGDHRFLCTLCWALTEVALLAHVDTLEAENQRLREGLEALADGLTPLNACGGHDDGEFAEHFRTTFGINPIPHYPDEGWQHCDGCSAAESADNERAALARRLRALLEDR